MKFQTIVQKSTVIVRLSLWCGKAGLYWIDFTRGNASEPDAGLMAAAIERQFREHITAIRENAYSEGWKDHRTRQTKKSFFDYCPDHIGRFN